MLEQLVPKTRVEDKVGSVWIGGGPKPGRVSRQGSPPTPDEVYGEIII